MVPLAVGAADRIPISALRAVFYPPLTNIYVSFSGGVGESAADPANYRLIAADGTRIPATRVGGFNQSHTNMPIFWDGLPLPGNFKSIEVANIADVYDPPTTMSPNPAQLPIERYVLFGRPEEGTPLAEDVQLSAHPSSAGTPMGLNTSITVDSDPDFPTAMSQALIRFPLPNGADRSPIPVGATITEARLELAPTLNGVGVPSEYSLHSMRIPWVETNATWNSFVNGVATNNVEASATPDIVFSPVAAVPPVVSVPVTARVLDWLRGSTPNHGWLIQPRTPFALHFYSAQYVPNEQRAVVLGYSEFPSATLGHARGHKLDRHAWRTAKSCKRGSDWYGSIFPTLSPAAMRLRLLRPCGARRRLAGANAKNACALRLVATAWALFRKCSAAEYDFCVAERKRPIRYIETDEICLQIIRKERHMDGRACGPECRPCLSDGFHARRNIAKT
jgi:hypothetical protein